jgi:hypothetical protein
MSTSDAPIPFERQSDAPGVRDCGAACLSMVYGSFGKPAPRAEIWPNISGRNRAGSVSSLTHRMVSDAIGRGFAALAVQARHPLQVLKSCHDSGVRTILNHRLTHDSGVGHYTVLAGLDQSTVLLHDPFYGPSRQVPQAELVELWQPRFPNSEVMGFLLIGIAAEPSPPAACWLCRKPIPPSLQCPHCKQEVKLQPNTFLGCIDPACIVRMWNYVCCPACDCGFSVSSAERAKSGASVVAEPVESGEAAEPLAVPVPSATQGAASLNFDKFFAQMDRFCELIMGLPGAASNAPLVKQIEYLKGTQQSLQLARVEAIASEKLAFDQMARMAEDARKGVDAHQARVDALNKPSDPLDGNALGRALMSNLGFTR